MWIVENLKFVEEDTLYGILYVFHVHYSINGNKWRRWWTNSQAIVLPHFYYANDDLINFSIVALQVDERVEPSNGMKRWVVGSLPVDTISVLHSTFSSKENF